MSGTPQINRRGWLVGVGVLVAVGMVVGAVFLFRMTFVTGDHHEEYSTYRSDPRGCRAIFEALGRSTEAGTVSRNLTPFSRVKETGDATVVMAGYTGNWIFGFLLPEAEIDGFESIVEGGARLVIALNPDRFRAIDAEAIQIAGSGSPPSGTGGDENDEAENLDLVDLESRWGFTLSRTDEPTDGGGGWITEPGPVIKDVVKAPPRWFGDLRITDSDGGWTAVLSANGQAVAAVRPFGDGEIVLLTDSFFLSNLGVATEPSVSFLRWVTGGRGRTVFDETHLGSASNPGIAGIVRAYRLHGFFVGLLVLGSLYVWKNASGLVPPDASAEGRRYGDSAVRGADAGTGFGRLLRRHVPREALLSTCYRTWFKSRARGPSFTAACADEVISTIEAEEAKPRRQQDAVGAYNKISTRIHAKSPAGQAGAVR